jgi:2-polyprenyl-6-methoxyphenol hydroxylase-like FAD-dependent oxidoreductase
MVEENEMIAPDPWVSHHKLTGEIVSGPEPHHWVKARLEDTGPIPTRLYRHNRARFLQMMLSQLARIGITVEYGRRAVDYYEDDQKAGVVLEDGEKMEADVIVAADGIGTKSHKLINGHDIRARPSGWGMFRTAFPVEAIAPDDELTERFKILDNGHPHIELWRGYVSLYRRSYLLKNTTDVESRSALFFAILQTEDTMSWVLQHKVTLFPSSDCSFDSLIPT